MQNANQTVSVLFSMVLLDLLRFAMLGRVMMPVAPRAALRATLASSSPRALRGCPSGSRSVASTSWLQSSRIEYKHLDKFGCASAMFKQA